jgi:hypothetical protein
MSSQVFAAKGRSRSRTMRALLSAAAVLIAAWAAALAFGAFGGFDSLPRPNLSIDGGDSPTEANASGLDHASGPDHPAPATRSAPRESIASAAQGARLRWSHVERSGDVEVAT